MRKRKLACSFFLTALFFADVAQAVQVGDAEITVRSAWGKPAAVRKKSDGAQVWGFKDGTTVWLADGIVQKITVPALANSIQKAGPAGVAAAPAPAKEISETTAAASAPEPAVQNERRTRAFEVIQQICYVLLCGVLAAIVIGKIRSHLAVLKARRTWHYR